MLNLKTILNIKKDYPNGINQSIEGKNSFIKYLNKAILESKTFKTLPNGYGVGDSERCIEIEFVRHNYQGENKVLDIGYSYSEPRWFDMIKSLYIPELVGLDIVFRQQPPDSYKKTVTADMRKTPFKDNTFDCIFCISTLEHVGMDNTIYGVPIEKNYESQIDAMKEMHRILKTKGKLILTLPFGKFMNYKWFIQYDLAALTKLIVSSKFKTQKIETYKVKKNWSFCRVKECKTVLYQEKNQRAGAVVCLILEK